MRCPQLARYVQAAIGLVAMTIGLLAAHSAFAAPALVGPKDGPAHGQSLWGRRTVTIKTQIEAYYGDVECRWARLAGDGVAIDGAIEAKESGFWVKRRSCIATFAGVPVDADVTISAAGYVQRDAEEEQGNVAYRTNGGGLFTWLRGQWTPVLRLGRCEPTVLGPKCPTQGPPPRVTPPSWPDPQPSRASGPTVVSPATSTPQATCELKSQGDANCDGAVNAVDFALATQESLGVRKSTDADFNADGVVDEQDLEIVTRNLGTGVLGDESRPDCPFKSKGDANCDGAVNAQDLAIAMKEQSGWSDGATADFNGDGAVDSTDIEIVTTNLGAGGD